MAVNAKEWILKGVGDSSDVRRDLDETARKLDAVDGTSAEVDLELQAQQFKTEIEGAKAELKALSAEEATPEVTLQMESLRAHIKQAEAQLAILGQKDVEIEAHVDTDSGRRGLLGFLGVVRNVWSGVGDVFTKGAQDAGSSMVGFGGSVSTEGGGSLSAFGKIAGETAAIVGIAMVAALGAGVTALIALAGSAGAAALALGALAIAAGALVIPFAVTAVGAIAVFKDSADEAGSAANALKERASGIADTFKSTLRPAADAVFRGLTAGLKGVPALLKTLQPAFTTLGKAIGSAFKTLGQEFTSPAWARFFKLLAGAAAQVVPLLTGSFIQFARILRNIATASMPFLIKGLKSLNGFLKDLAGGTSNAQQTRDVIGGLVKHLVAWAKLGAEIGKVFFDVLKAAAPIGLQIVKFLTQGARSLADWVSSSEGQERIKQFFEDVLPLIKEMATFLGQLAIIFIEVFQAIAPSLAFVFQGLNLLLKPIVILLDLFNRIPASVRSWIIPFAGVFSTVNSIVGIVRLLIPLVAGVGQAIARVVTQAPGDAWGWVRDKAAAAFGVVKSIASGAAAAVSAIVSAGKAAWGWITQAAKNVVGTVRNLITGLAGVVGRTVSRAVGAPWHWITDAAKGAAGAVRGVISTLVGWVKERINDAIDIIKSIVSAINDVKSKAAAAARALADAIKAPINAVIDGINAIRLHVHIGGIDPPGPGPKIPSFDADIDPFPTIPRLARGVRDFFGGLAVVGETGPELVNLPRGSDVLTSGDSRSMARRMGGDTIINNTINAPAGELPDPGATLALFEMKQRSRGQR